MGFDSRRVASAFDRLIRQQSVATYSHMIAILLLAIAYVSRHAYGQPIATRHGGFFQFLASWAAWWPVLISWRYTREPNETGPSFIVWMVLFWTINLAVCAVHIVQWPERLAEHPVVLSLLHLIALSAIIPLAIEKAYYQP